MSMVQRLLSQQIRRRWDWEELSLVQEALLRTLKGNIMHITASFVKDLSQIDRLEEHLNHAFFILGEDPRNWDLEKEFLKPLTLFFSNTHVRPFFL